LPGALLAALFYYIWRHYRFYKLYGIPAPSKLNSSLILSLNFLYHIGFTIGSIALFYSAIWFLQENSLDNIPIYFLIFIAVCFGAKSVVELYYDKDIDFLPGIGFAFLLLSIIYIWAKLGIYAFYVSSSSLIFICLIKSSKCFKMNYQLIVL